MVDSRLRGNDDSLVICLLPLPLDKTGHDAVNNKRYLPVDWPAPSHIKAVVTTRQSEGFDVQDGFSAFNLGLYSGEAVDVIQTNRQQLQDDLKLAESPLWLKQIHGIEVADVATSDQEVEADASVSSQPGMAAAVLTADCLPVLFTNVDGSVVAAAHAGWKGLVNGVLESTVTAMNVAPATVMAWFGPAISQSNFEVGPEVREQFLAADAGCEAAFIPGKGDRWFADLYALATRRLNRIGVEQIYGGGFCTFDQQDQFYSYRRDGKTSGRMASLIWIQS
ncbi:peptidoglycan editing factor PgeF [Endozoicomonas ascidiicola]|uniref:peptidoglycan editing factor PgeF n=1 Tax=Endozoicomonas ascidiicola TaxID=1698521 RepID=UPI000BA39AD1|nr:peptidoglycan editing factor PgeF [Endozoicomonas ascidiicola]